MNRLFDTSVNVGLRQFYVLGAKRKYWKSVWICWKCVYLWTQCADDFLCPVYIGHI